MAEPPSIDHRREEMNTESSENVAAYEKKLRPPPEHAPKCPRCDSENTKFCYYNNYSLSQPRYFCKSCRRYWTKGGTLRNVPIGGGCRKNKRSAKRSLDRIDLLLQSRMENNNVLIGTSSADHQSFLSDKAAFSNLSSPLSYGSSGSGESLSMAFARLQKQFDVGDGHLGLGFGLFDHQNFVQAPIFANPVSNLHEKRTNVGFLSSFSERQPTSNFNAQISLYNNNGLLDENYGHTQQSQLPYDNQLSCIDLMSVKQDNILCDDNRILREFPWQMGINNNGHGNGGCISFENDYMNFNNNNLVLGSSDSSSVGNGYELRGGRESESASAPSWRNLVDTSVLM